MRGRSRARCAGNGVVLALLIGALLIVFAFVLGDPTEAGPAESVVEAIGGSGEGHVRGNVFGGDANITISEGNGSQHPPRRTRVRLSLEDLTKIYRDHTTIQAKKLAEPYIGGWLEVKGLVSNVTDDASGGGYQVSLDIDHEYVFATFIEEAQEQLPQLQRGEEVTILGRITKIDSYTLALEEAELLESD